MKMIDHQIDKLYEAQAPKLRLKERLLLRFQLRVKLRQLVIMNLLVLISSHCVVGCIEDPPRLDRDPDEVSGGEGFSVAADLGAPLDEEDGSGGGVDADVSADLDVDIGGATGADRGPEAGTDVMIDATVELDEDLEPEPDLDPPLEWPALDLPLPEPEEERCDGLDNDLDALIDEGLTNPCGGCEPFDEERGCVGWYAGLVQTQQRSEGGGLEEGALEEGTLNPDRLLTISAAVLSYETFELEGARCEWVRSPQVWDEARSIGAVTLDTPSLGITLTPDAGQPGRYRVIGEEEPFVLHRATDEIAMSWGGRQSESPEGLTIEPGALSLTSPALVELATPLELDALAEALRRPEDESAPDEAVALRWIPEPLEREGELIAGPTLRLYIGGSQSLFQRGAYRGIRHYLLSGELFDDGRLDLGVPSDLRAPGSSIWVYLERASSASDVASVHPVRMRVGHRAEIRSGARGGEPETPPAIELLTPSPIEPEPEITEEGLSVSWRLTPDLPPPTRVVVSLIRYGSGYAEQLGCVITDPTQTSLTLPSERLSFWPRDPQSVRQLTVRADTKQLELGYPDRGRLTRSDSVILRLSDL